MSLVLHALYSEVTCCSFDLSGAHCTNLPLENFQCLLHHAFVVMWSFSSLAVVGDDRDVVKKSFNPE